MKSIRQRLMEAVALRCSEILVADGYATDLGEHVYVWRAGEFGAHELPAINLKDVRCESASQSPNNHHHTLTIEAGVIASTGASTADTVRKMIADLQQAIGVDRHWTEAATNDRLAHRTDLVSDEMSVEIDGRTIGGARLTFTVQFRTAPYDPYTLA